MPGSQPKPPAPPLPSTTDLNRLSGELPPSEPDPRVGQSIGKYLLQRLLGKGGMGAVYLAEDTVLGRQVAIKLISEQLSLDQEAAGRFQREARLVSQINHPNVVTVYEADQAGGNWFLVMEYVTAGNAVEQIK